MLECLRRRAGALALVLPLGFLTAAHGAEETISGEPLDRSLIGPETISYGEDEQPVGNPKKSGAKEPGKWVTPSERNQFYAASGMRAITNKFGDTRMFIGFPEPADVEGFFIAGFEQDAISASGLLILGYRNGEEVARADWAFDLAEEPQWLALDFRNVDRIELQACAKIADGAWYSLDDLTYRFVDADASEPTVLDFEDLPLRSTLTGTDYGGLEWETGAGAFPVEQAVPGPVRFRDVEAAAGAGSEDDGSELIHTRGGSPLRLLLEFPGADRADAGFTFPPDTHGAIGPNHYVEVTNGSFSVYARANGALIQRTGLGSVMPGGSGDPRVLYDQFSDRWVVIDSDFSERIYLSVSLTNDPRTTSGYFRTSFSIRGGVDANAWPDYPTLGVDANGIYMGYFPVGGGGMSIAAIDKAPLIGSPPALGAVTFFRGLPWEGALQPVHTYGNPGGAYIVSRTGTNQIRVRRVNPPLNNPTLTQLGFVNVASFANPPDAPALNTSVNMDTIDTRLMNAMFINGSIWTAHTVSFNGKASVRWYELRTAPLGLIQQGTITDSTRHYYFPAICANDSGEAVIAFSGSSSSEFVGIWYSGRRPFDPIGAMTAPVQLIAGQSAINNIDNAGRNRWGDYSQTALDPADNRTFWTAQTHAGVSGRWDTRMAVLAFDDCNQNGIPDDCDVDCSCSLPGCGQSLDCNNNLTPDECEPDCNGNGVPDTCDIAAGNALDCNDNDVPDSCDIFEGTSADCNGNGIPDECDLSSGFAVDCNENGIPDSCDIATKDSEDCNGNSIPDECEIASGALTDCDGNGVPDVCDLALGNAFDCNANGVLDNCDIADQLESASAEQGPIDNQTMQNLLVAGLPAAESAVIVEIRARADLSLSSEFLTVTLNGQSLGDVFTSGGSDCATPYAIAQVSLSQVDFNNLVVVNGGGTAVVDVVASPGVNAGLCQQPASFVQVAFKYQDGFAGATDSDNNGVPDACQANLMGDLNCDGQVTVSDIAAFVLAITDPAGYAAQFPGCYRSRADLSGDGVVSVSDIGPFVVRITGG